jgi:hypothetical protein
MKKAKSMLEVLRGISRPKCRFSLQICANPSALDDDRDFRQQMLTGLP